MYRHLKTPIYILAKPSDIQFWVMANKQELPLRLSGMAVPFAPVEKPLWRKICCPPPKPRTGELRGLCFSLFQIPCFMVQGLHQVVTMGHTYGPEETWGGESGTWQLQQERTCASPMHSLLGS